MEPKHLEKCTCRYHTLFCMLKPTKKWTQKSMLAEARLCESKL